MNYFGSPYITFKVANKVLLFNELFEERRLFNIP